MRRIFAGLLAGSSMLIAVAAHAGPVAAAPDATAEAPAEDPATEIVVIGKGETRQVQTLSQADIEQLAPGTSPLKAVEKLPSVNFQSADPFGAYEWSERISIRGFNQNQLGFTLDGIPLGDGSYGNVNGLHISRAISSENVGEIQVSQGSGSIGTQATNNLGGTLEFFSRDPAHDFGLALDGTYGSHETVRLYGRLESGDLTASGARGYVSYVYSDMDKWKGFGSQRQNQVNAKAVIPTGPLDIVGTFDFSDRRENDYQDMSLGMIRRLGYDWDNISNDFPLAVLIADIANNRGDTGAPVSNPAAGTEYPAPFQSVDDAYFNAAGLRQDYLGSLGVQTAAGAAVHGQIKGYYHSNHGQGLWYTPYVPSPSGVPISIRTTEYDIRRGGIFGDIGTKIGFNDVTVGGWWELNNFRQARRFYGLDSRTEPTRDSLDFQSDPFFTQWDWKYRTETAQYYVEDKLAFGDLVLNLGWKGFGVTAKADPIVGGGLAGGRIRTEDWFQPHAGFTFTLSPHAELFGGFTEVTRAFVASATGGPFATTQDGFDALLSGDTKLKPETSDTYEFGARFRKGGVTGFVSGYYVDFRNRLLGVTTGAGIVGNPVILQNVGSVRSYGLETALDAKIWNGIGAYLSYSYNNSTYRDNVNTVDGNGDPLTIPVRGKNVVDTPQNLVKAELSYDSAILFGNVTANYMSRRYFTYLNDQSVPDRATVDAAIGVRLPVAGRKVEIQANVVNLFDKDYVATLGSNGFGNSGDNQTLLPGSPRQVFLTVRTGF